MNSSLHQYEVAGKGTEQDELKAALDSTFAIASVGIATLKMLETLLPAAAKEVEHESGKITSSFMKVVDHLNSQSTPVPEEVKQAIMSITIGLQFQDRNTQITENVTCILERYRNMLDEVCSNIKNMRDGNVATGQNIANAVEHILSSIRLSDIRARYVEALAKAKVHSHEPAQTSSAQDNDDKEIEIF